MSISVDRTVGSGVAGAVTPLFRRVLASGLGYGYLRAGSPEDYVPFIALGNVVSLMHFWYDGFVWSVRKGDV